MTASSLPKRISVGKLCGRGAVYSDTLIAGHLPRLQSLLMHDDWRLDVSVRGSVLPPRTDAVSGSVRGAVPLTCARCLETFMWPLSLDLSVMVAGSEAEAERLEPEHDTWIVSDDMLALLECVEDEIILALPALPRCSNEGCSGQARVY